MHYKVIAKLSYCYLLAVLYGSSSSTLGWCGLLVFLAILQLLDRRGNFRHRRCVSAVSWENKEGGSQQAGRTKTHASYFLAEQHVSRADRKGTGEGNEQAKGEVMVNSSYRTEQPPDTLNSSQFGNATESFSLLCWASRARRVCPGECLKPQLWLKMAFWG